MTYASKLKIIILVTDEEFDLRMVLGYLEWTFIWDGEILRERPQIMIVTIKSLAVTHGHRTSIKRRFVVVFDRPPLQPEK